jgi:hypothetical protein
MKESSYHIATKDGSSSLNYFTTSRDAKTALRKLIEESSDFKNLCKAESELITITIKKLK